MRRFYWLNGPEGVHIYDSCVPGGPFHGEHKRVGTAVNTDLAERIINSLNDVDMHAKAGYDRLVADLKKQNAEPNYGIDIAAPSGDTTAFARFAARHGVRAPTTIEEYRDLARARWQTIQRQLKIIKDLRSSRDQWRTEAFQAKHRVLELQGERDTAAADYAKLLNAARGRTLGVSMVDWITHLEDKAADAQTLQAAWQGCLDQANANAANARSEADSLRNWRSVAIESQNKLNDAERELAAMKVQQWPEEAARLSKLINEARDILAKV